MITTPKAFRIDGGTVARFWPKVRKTAGCWEWLGARISTGYGEITLPQGRQVLAHRFAWVQAHGPIPQGLLVLHRCDNRACVRPTHLFLGTQQDNVRDAVRKGRLVNPRKFSEATVAWVRALFAVGARRARIVRLTGVSLRHIYILRERTA